MQKDTVFSILKTVAWILVIVCLITFIASGVFSFLYMDGFAGLIGLFILPIFAVGIAVISIFIIIVATKQKINTGFILLGIVIILNISTLLFSIEGLKEANSEKNSHDSYVISTENPTFENCLSLPSPQKMNTCGNALITKYDNLLSCLKLSKESYIRYPKYFEYPGFTCSFNTGDANLGLFKYNSTLLDKPEKLAEVLDIFEKSKTDFYKESDSETRENATSYSECLTIQNSEVAKYCAQNVLNITKNYRGCIKLSYDHGQKIAELKEIVPDYFECKLGGLVNSGSIYNQGIDFDGEIQAQITVNSQGLYLTEQDAKTDLAYRYCIPQQVTQVDKNSETVNSDIREAMEILNVNILYQSCADLETYKNAHSIDDAYEEIKAFDLYQYEIMANRGGESSLQCNNKSHVVKITDSQLSKELTDKLLDLGITSAFRPCQDEAEYSELKELSNLDWDFNSQNSVVLKSLSNTIIIDDFSINPIIAPIYISLFSKDFNYNGYDYAVGVVFDNPDKIEIGRSTELNFASNSHPISLKKQKENTTGRINYCEISKAPENWFVNVIEFEKKLGGVFTIEFEATADCDGELFKITGQYKIRLPLGYRNQFME